jgi:hypothetical protein
MEIFLNLFRKKEKENNAFMFANKLLDLQKQIDELKINLQISEEKLNRKIDNIQPVVYNLHTKE